MLRLGFRVVYLLRLKISVFLIVYWSLVGVYVCVGRCWNGKIINFV